MNNEEIAKMVKELRCYGLTNGGTLGRHMGIMDVAADLLESLQTQLVTAQRREKAAVEDMNCIAIKISQCTDLLSGGEDRVRDLKLGRCDVCKGICRENETCKFEWRGQQEGLR